MGNENIYVASSSISRKNLANEMGLNWKFVNNAFDEETYKKIFKVNTLQQAMEYTKFLSNGKAFSIINNYDGIIIGCDSVAFLKGRLLEKPKDIKEFYSMMDIITKYSHHLITGVTIYNTTNRKHCSFCEITKLYFDPFTNEQKEILLNKYNGLQNAGGYTLNESIEGNTHIIKGTRDNVIGLPIKRIINEINNM